MSVFNADFTFSEHVIAHLSAHFSQVKVNSKMKLTISRRNILLKKKTFMLVF